MQYSYTLRCVIWNKYAILLYHTLLVGVQYEIYPLSFPFHLRCHNGIHSDIIQLNCTVTQTPVLEDIKNPSVIFIILIKDWKISENAGVDLIFFPTQSHVLLNQIRKFLAFGKSTSYHGVYFVALLSTGYIIIIMLTILSCLSTTYIQLKYSYILSR